MNELSNEDKIKVDVKKINQELLKNLENYRKTLSYLNADAPIGVLCLPKVIENALLADGCLRVYDLFDRDLAEIKGIGKTRVERLTSSLNEFFSMC